MTTLPLLHPVMPWVTGVGIALVFLLLWWPRRRRPRVFGALVLAGLVAAMTVGWLVDKVWKTFGDPVGWVIWQWAAFATACVLGALAPQVPRAATPRRRNARLVRDVVAALLAVVMAGLAFNFHYSMYRTPRDLWTPTALTELPPVPQRTGTPRLERPASGWVPPADVPAKGSVSTVDIPGTVSGFRARPGRVYTPPAYGLPGHPQLPVLILMAGQPGEPDYWVKIGHIDEIMDAYAASHGGLAPVVVIPDHLGAPTNNPLCADAHLGRNATYLEVDVVNWAIHNLDVDPDTTRWAVAGLSNGGTCATQLATRRPDLFTTFVSISGEREPSLGDEKRTLAVGFERDRARFAANNPLDLMAERRYPATLGLFTVGDKDAKFTAYANELIAAGQAAGMDARLLVVPGGHDWAAWVGGLKAALPLILPRMGLS